MWRSIVSYVGAQQANKAWRDNIIVASDTTYGRRGHRARKFAVDDTEIVLASLLGIPIHALELVTMTGTPLHQLVGIDGRFERDAHAEARRLSMRSEEHTSELQSPCNLVCRLLLEKKKKSAYM